MQSKKYFFYILECRDKSLYSGITVDLERRVREHNFSKLGAKYTRVRRPVKIVFSKRFGSRSLASKEEARVKKLSRAEKIKMLPK
ncbi:MAG: GIY-YIG nuclease family protein [Nitrospira sp.]